jgi:hypothetical protein
MKVNKNDGQQDQYDFSHSAARLMNCVFRANGNTLSALITFCLIDHSFAVRAKFDGIHRTYLNAFSTGITGTRIYIIFGIAYFITTNINKNTK